MNDTLKSVILGLALALALGIIAVAICAVFQRIIGIFAGFFAWIIIQLAIIA